MRYKEIVGFDGLDHRVVFQGVHMMMNSDVGQRWLPDEARKSKLVFIGRSLPKAKMIAGLERCLMQ